jgi:hypothetical protein
MGLAPLVPEDFKLLTESIVCERRTEAKAWIGAGKGAEAKQIAMVQILIFNFAAGYLSHCETVLRTMAHVVRLILAGQLLIDSK